MDGCFWENVILSAFMFIFVGVLEQVIPFYMVRFDFERHYFLLLPVLLGK